MEGRHGEQLPLVESQGRFLSGTGISLLFGLILTVFGFTVPVGPSGVLFWNIMIIAFGLPVAAGSLALMWARKGKSKMVSGAKMIFMIGCIVAIGVTIWYVSLLNSLGN